MKARENPFRVDRLHALAFRPQGTDWFAMLHRLEALNHRAAIVGPHGSGKTTLMYELAARLEQRGRRALHILLNEDSPRLGRDDLKRTATLGIDGVVLCDGAGHLSSLAWWRLRHAAHCAGGLIITAHKPGRLPTWIETRTDPALLSQLINELRGNNCTFKANAAELFHRHRGDVRAALRELYHCAAT